MTIWQRWQQTALHNKGLVLSSVLTAFGTLFYCWAAFTQLQMFERSSREASEQTEKLILAASKIQSSADSIKGSAGAFSQSAAGINSGIQDAVEKLNAQAELTKDIAVASGKQADASRMIAETGRNTLDLSERAFVTIGKSDGTIADFILPRDKAQNADIVVYFQNTGRLPARFKWGTIAAFQGSSSEAQLQGLSLTHPYQGPIQVTRSPNGYGEVGESSVIAGGSVVAFRLGTIPQDELSRFYANRMSFIVNGIFEYCDELENGTTSMFMLRYQSTGQNGSLNFDLASVLSAPNAPVGKDNILPCEGFGSRRPEQRPHD